MAKFSALLLLSWLLLAGAAHAQAVYFAPAATYTTGDIQPNDLAVADMNGDSHPDLVVANYDGVAGLCLLLGNGDGTFQAAVPITTPGMRGRRLAVGDLNGDGAADLVQQYLSSVVVTLGNAYGTGTLFQAPVSYAANCLADVIGVALADVNSDGKLDILACYDHLPQTRVFLNQGAGTFGAATLVTTSADTNPYDSDFRVADMNGDNKPDLLLGSWLYDTDVRVVLGNGNGTFRAPLGTYTNAGFAVHFAVADLNKDGKADVFTTNCNGYGSPAAGWMKGNGNGTLQYANNTGQRIMAVTASDVNLDGNPDIIGVDTGFKVYLGNGNGTLQSPISYPLGRGMIDPGVLSYLVAADVNHDGRPDLILTDRYSKRVSVLLNSATPLPTRAALPGATASLAPNPAGAGTTTLTLGGLPAAVTGVQATVLDITGRLVARHALAVAAGAARAELPTAGLAPGLYVLRLAAHDAPGQPAGELPALRLRVE